MEVAQYLKEKADTKRKKSSSQKRKITAVTEKFTWSNEMLEDLVDIVCSDEETKKMLIFRNQKFAANNALYRKVVMELNQRIKGSFPFEVTFTQARNKFKKLISECKAQSVTQRTATSLSRSIVEKGYGKLWDELFPLVASRESSDRSNNIEPSADTDSDENNSFEGTAQEELDRRSKDYVPTRPPSSKKKKRDSFSDCLQSIAKSFVEKDPTDTLLKFLSEENERSRRHEMQMMQFLI